MTETTTVRYASAWRRVMAAGLDLLIFLLILGGVGWPAFKMLVELDSPEEIMVLILLALGYVIGFGYYATCWHAFGATPGRMLFKLRIVDLRNPGVIGLSGGKALSRMLFSNWVNGTVQGLGYLAVIISPQRQTWFERISHTATIYVPAGQSVSDISVIPLEKKRVVIYVILLVSMILSLVGQVAIFFLYQPNRVP